MVLSQQVVNRSYAQELVHMLLGLTWLNAHLGFDAYTLYHPIPVSLHIAQAKSASPVPCREVKRPSKEGREKPNSWWRALTMVVPCCSSRFDIWGFGGVTSISKRFLLAFSKERSKRTIMKKRPHKTPEENFIKGVCFFFPAFCFHSFSISFLTTLCCWNNLLTFAPLVRGAGNRAPEPKAASSPVKRPAGAMRRRFHAALLVASISCFNRFRS